MMNREQGTTGGWRPIRPCVLPKCCQCVPNNKQRRRYDRRTTTDMSQPANKAPNRRMFFLFPCFPFFFGTVPLIRVNLQTKPRTDLFFSFLPSPSRFWFFFSFAFRRRAKKKAWCLFCLFFALRRRASTCKNINLQEHQPTSIALNRRVRVCERVLCVCVSYLVFFLFLK